MMQMLLVAIPAYLLGSVSFGLLMSRAFGLGDLRSIGSGNIGATNVLRTGNKKAALLTLLGDGAKGALAVILARLAFSNGLGEGAAGIAALAALVGHMWPCFSGFKGGKGVATFLGACLALSWPVGALSCAIWLVVALIFRISSVAALAAVVLAPLWALLFYHWHGAAIVGIMAILVIWQHRDNITRLQNGTEPRIGAQ